MAATRFSDSATATFDLSKSRPKYTTTSAFANPLQVWPRRLFTRVFRITVNFATFRTISSTVESTSGFWTVLPGSTDLDLVHPVFLSKAFLAIHVRYGDNAGQNKAKKSVQGAVEAKPEVEIWRRPVFLTQRPRLSICPKVGQSTQLLPVLQIHFRFDQDNFLHAFFELLSISRHFGPFRALLKVLPVSELHFWATDLDSVHTVF